MDKQTQEDIIASGADRAGFYRFLAGVYLWEPKDAQIEAMASAGFPVGDDAFGRGYALIAEYLRHRDTGTRQQIAVDYAHTFLGAGNYDKLMAPPYESVYTSEEHLLMQDARDGALSFYRSEGLDLPEENTTPEDHIGFEMQFMATLVERACEALVAGEEGEFARLVRVQREFYAQHLANWLPAFVADIERHCKTDYYRGMAQLTRAFLAEEDEQLKALASEAAAAAAA